MAGAKLARQARKEHISLWQQPDHLDDMIKLSGMDMEAWESLSARLGTVTNVQSLGKIPAPVLRDAIQHSYVDMPDMNERTYQRNLTELEYDQVGWAWQQAKHQVPHADATLMDLRPPPADWRMRHVDRRDCVHNAVESNDRMIMRNMADLTGHSSNEASRESASMLNSMAMVNAAIPPLRRPTVPPNVEASITLAEDPACDVWGDAGWQCDDGKLRLGTPMDHVYLLEFTNMTESYLRELSECPELQACRDAVKNSECRLDAFATSMVFVHPQQVEPLSRAIASCGGLDLTMNHIFVAADLEHTLKRVVATLPVREHVRLKGRVPPPSAERPPPLTTMLRPYMVPIVLSRLFIELTDAEQLSEFIDIH